MLPVEPLQVRFTEEFASWLHRLRNPGARRAITARIDRLKTGNVGDFRPVGDTVSELRIDHGPGYRVYFTKVGRLVVVLLCGGDKSSQPRDIAQAKRLAAELRGDGS